MLITFGDIIWMCQQQQSILLTICNPLIVIKKNNFDNNNCCRFFCPESLNAFTYLEMY